MTGPTRARRNGTARELAERYGVSPRTIQNLVAEERAVFLKRAADRHEKIRALHAKGMTYRAIAAEVGCSIGTVHYALKKTAA